jgi:Uri superfamily endonuclease
MTNVYGTGYYVAMFTTYVLVIGKRGSSPVRIGRQRVYMEESVYLYVGSAKRGLNQRLARHMKKRKNRFWHIDYITCRRDTAVRAVFLAPYPECETLSVVSRLGAVFGRRLGSSDCKCQSHFVKLNQVSLDDVRSSMAQEGFVEFFCTRDP